MRFKTHSFTLRHIQYVRLQSQNKSDYIYIYIYRGPHQGCHFSSAAAGCRPPHTDHSVVKLIRDQINASCWIVLVENRWTFSFPGALSKQARYIKSTHPWKICPRAFDFSWRVFMYPHPASLQLRSQPVHWQELHTACQILDLE